MAQEKEVLLIDSMDVGDTATGVEVRVLVAKETVVPKKAQQGSRYCPISIMQQQQQQQQM